MKENIVFPFEIKAITGRVTRAAAARAAGKVLPPKAPPVKLEKKQIQKRKMQEDEKGHAAASLPALEKRKRRQVLKNVTNVCCETSNKSCITSTKPQQKVSQMIGETLGPGKFAGTGSLGKFSVCSSMNFEFSDHQRLQSEVTHMKMARGIQEFVVLESQQSFLAPQNAESVKDAHNTCDIALFEGDSFRKGAECHIQNDKDRFCKDPGYSSGSKFINIDSDHTNPQMCCHYSVDIYNNLRATELIRRPSSNFLETLQRDITHSMRGILVDWLVEVSDEYKLVPDTLYLSVHIIDQFLSQNHIERQRLQLLGITSMLIASKYEEISAPRVEEFCFITDNTYTKEEVLKMEVEVLKLSNFQLCVPTIKTFLRRFVRAAQISYKFTSLSLTHMASYLAELTLIEYSFLKFLPSQIAASAVFLAIWTVEHPDDPWNETLKHYTSYKASDLKETVEMMQHLQMNSNDCPLNAIRVKYNDEKLDCVAAMAPRKLHESLFC